MNRAAPLSCVPVARRRGFTLIEISVVILVVALFATLVVPNVVSAREGQRRRDAYASILRLAQEAKVRAIETGNDFEMAYDDGAGTLRLTEIKAAQNGEPEERTDSTSITLPDGIRVTTFRADGADTSAGDWKLMFYADGKSNGGGIEISEQNSVRSLIVNKSAQARMTDGNLPDIETESWTAGDYVHRS